jgi:aldose sugar dehydrogenase
MKPFGIVAVALIGGCLVACKNRPARPSEVQQGAAQQGAAQQNPAASPKGAPTKDDAPAGQPACLLLEDDFGPAGKLPIRAEIAVRGLTIPWGIAFISEDEWLVTERPGRVRLIRQRKLIDAPVAELPIAKAGEGGLRDIELHPSFAENRLFYLYATVSSDEEPSNRVELWRLAPDHRSAMRERIVLDRIPAAKYHDGGRMRFGADGMLYVAVGDAGEPDHAQDPSSLSGKILRITAEGERPGDNPFPDSLAYMIGLRNPQAFDWLGANTLVIADHGPSGEMLRRGHDEVSVADKGQNLGWPPIYGCEREDGMVTPLIVWEDAAPPGGALIYRGQRIPEWRNSLLVATLRSEHLQRIELSSQPPWRVLHNEVYFAEKFGRLRTLALSPRGELYVTTSNCDGRGDCPDHGDVILEISR